MLSSARQARSTTNTLWLWLLQQSRGALPAQLGRAVNSLDEPALMDTRGNIGRFGPEFCVIAITAMQIFCNAPMKNRSTWETDMESGNGSITTTGFSLIPP